MNRYQIKYFLLHNRILETSRKESKVSKHLLVVTSGNWRSEFYADPLVYFRAMLENTVLFLFKIFFNFILCA